MAMFEYAESNETGRLLHIDDAARGKKCNCVCPGCGDQMIAKQGKVKEHHFAHAASEQNYCYMTMVHRFFQEYFSEQEFLDIPATKLSVLDNQVDIPRRKVKVLNARLEATIGNYRADILLLTSIGEIAIEVYVTSRSKDEKINYYKRNSIATIEYDFSGYKNRTIEDARKAFKTGRIRTEIIQYPKYEYYLSKVKKENTYLVDVISNRVNKVVSQDENLLYIPAFKHLLNIDYKNKWHDLNLTFVKECITKFDRMDKNYFNGIHYIDCVRKNAFLKVIYLPIGKAIPAEFLQANYSLLVKHISYNSKFSETSSWFRYIPLYKKLKESDDEIHDYFSAVRELEESVLELSNLYLEMNKEQLYKRFYGKWRKYLIKNKLVSENVSNSVRIPELLNCFRAFSSFWMFNSWSVFILTNLIEIIDGYEIGSHISYTDVFHKLTSRFYLTKEASMIFSSEIDVEYVSEGKKHLILIPDIIQAMTSNFISYGHIQAFERYFVKKENLLPLLAIEFDKLNSTTVS
ncbi:hypothetical protein [Photorhabdus akhurstii]|uniref:competence protein CoiA family protein n=1 Tax=Photorhabdus akhurstii TaxID=171438 RepID=UPI003703A701